MTPNQQQFVAWSAIIALAGLLLWVLSPVLMPFVVAAVLAYVLSPLVKGLLRRAFDAMMRDEAFLAEADRLKIDIDPMTGEETQAAIVQILATPPDVIARTQAALGTN